MNTNLYKNRQHLLQQGGAHFPRHNHITVWSTGKKIPYLYKKIKHLNI